MTARKVVMVGDKTTADGVVLPNNNSSFSISGHKAALIGGLVSCPACKSTGVIAKAGGPQRMNHPSWDTKRDISILKEVRHEDDFKKAWAEIDAEVRARNAEVVLGLLFLHASKPTGESSGFEFAPATTGADATLKREEMHALPKLRWATGAKLDLRGCNTGMVGERRSWSVAEVMAKAQGVTTTGQMGYSYFSASKNRFEETSSSTNSIYLWAFRRNKNDLFGDGSAIPERIFSP